MTKIKAVIFDLDGVLLDESQYVFAAYKDIAAFLAPKCNLPESQIYERLVKDFRTKSSMYPRLFNDVVADLGLSESLVPEILGIFSRVNVPLSLSPEARKVLIALREKVKLALVTNGIVATQRNKVHLLGIEGFFDLIVYVRERGKEYEKPNPEAYRYPLAELGVEPKSALCIGDNPYLDFRGAKQLGMFTVRLLIGEFKNARLSEEYEAEVTVNNLQELLSMV